LKFDFMWPSNEVGAWGNVVNQYESESWTEPWGWSAEGQLNNWGWHGYGNYNGVYTDWSYPGGFGLKHDTWYRIVVTVDTVSTINGPKLLSTIKTYEKEGVLVNTAQILGDIVAGSFLDIGARSGGESPRGAYIDNV
jgi:hypothetical protein